MKKITKAINNIYSSTSRKVIIKGSSSLYFQKIITRKPNDVDISISAGYYDKDNVLIWKKIKSSFSNSVDIINNHFLKSFYGDFVKIEWLTKKVLQNEL